VKKNIFLILSLFLLLFIVYKAWFFPGLIAAGDLWSISQEQFSLYTLQPFAWSPQLNNGFGGNSIFLLWNYLFLAFPIYFWGKLFQAPFETVERLGYLLPLLFIIILSSFVWARHFFKKNFFLQILSFLIFFFNTYILMIISGGQLGVAFAYSFAPLVVLSFIKLLGKSNVRQMLLTGLLFSIQVSFDLRIA